MNGNGAVTCTTDYGGDGDGDGRRGQRQGLRRTDSGDGGWDDNGGDDGDHGGGGTVVGGTMAATTTTTEEEYRNWPNEFWVTWG